MILDVPRQQADAILGAMRAVALAHGPEGVSDADRRTVEAAARIVFGLPERAGDDATPVSPSRLASTLTSEEAARQATRFLSIVALVDGRVDQGKLGLVAEYAAALDVHEDYLQVLTEAAEGEIASAAACMIRKNTDSFPHLDHGLDLLADPIAPLLPYRDGNDDPALAARYAALGALAEGTFGRAFFDHFQRNGFAFPGDPNGLAEGFTTPHDSSHVLAGYSTTEIGELCVSTFIGAMHPDHPMAAEVLPVIFSWHMGIKLNEIARSTTGVFDPRRFWTAWDRGEATTVDVVAADWDFWGATGVPLEDLRREYGIPPLDPSLAA